MNQLTCARRCHFYDEAQDTLGCFCRFKTCWTQAQIQDKLLQFGCTLARKLGSSFAAKDRDFVTLAR